MRLIHEIPVFQTVKSIVIISLFEINLKVFLQEQKLYSERETWAILFFTVSVSRRDLYNSFKSIKEKPHIIGNVVIIVCYLISV